MDDAPRDEQVRKRLEEAASHETALHQLRRRYDELRQDYETLVKRLSELEDDEPGAAAEPPAAPGSRPLLEAMTAPLFALYQQYVNAARDAIAIAEGVGRLAGIAPAATSGPGRATVEAGAAGPGEMLDFQEQLARLPAVSRVSLRPGDGGRATFVVELRG